MTKLTRAVILESYPLTGRKFKALSELFNEYKETLEELVLIALENKISEPYVALYSMRTQCVRE